MRRPSDDHGGEYRLTSDELAHQAVRRDTDTLVHWWLCLTYELHSRCRSDQLPGLLEEALSEPVDRAA